MKKAIIKTMAGVLLVSLIACEDQIIRPASTQEENPQGTKYVITTGKHDSNQVPGIKQGVTTLRFRAMFDSTARYTTINSNNQDDINKLYGLSDCSTLHQVNSARFGWRWVKGQLEIWAYVYSNSVREYKFIGKAALNVYHHYEIKFDDNIFIFKLDSTAVELARNCSGVANGYKLFPYFGGDETAPHDITIWIQDLE